MKHLAEALTYNYDALEPFIDQKTMEIHHGKHYVGYVDKLNLTLEPYAELQEKSLTELLGNLNNVPADIRTAVQNSGGGAINHAMFWKLLKKDTVFGGEISEAINNQFGSLEEFKKQFTEAALKIFGSGWTWLVVASGQLEILNTPNQDTPLSMGKNPILGLDIWEHAYYLKYQNRRPEYVEGFFNIINWEQANEYYLSYKL